jgi:hypothetical protein
MAPRDDYQFGRNWDDANGTARLGLQAAFSVSYTGPMAFGVS